MWALLTAARKAYKTWKSLDPQHRDAVGAEARRVRTLAVELGGSAAARFVDGSADTLDAGEVPTTSRRPKAAVAAELRAAVEALSRACVAPGAKIVGESTPAPVRLGARVMKAGARRAAPRLQRFRSDGVAELPAANVPAPGWYEDPLGRFAHRWWDGERWTEHIARDGVTEVDPLGAQSSPSVEHAQAGVPPHVADLSGDKH